MGTFRRSSSEWTDGWFPSMDAYNGPPSALPNAVNMVPDEQGVLSLRRGSASSFTAPGGELNVNNIYTAVLNSSPTSLSVYRVVAVGDSIYVNGSRRDQNIDGSGDIKIHHAFGKIFWSRGTRHRKQDGDLQNGGDNGGGTYNWGIAAPTQAPSISVEEPDGATFASCTAAEVPPFEANEGELQFVEDHNEDGDSAILMTCSEETGRATATRLLGSPQDFTVYDGGDTGIDEDIIEMFLKVANPTNLDTLTLMFDCNPASAAPFQDDYFSYEFTQDVVTAAKNTGVALSIEDRGGEVFKQEIAQYILDAQNSKQLPNRPVPGSQGPQFKIRKDADWARVAVPRKAFLRNGGTTDCGWNSITAVRIVATSLSETQRFDEISIDSITISGGANHPFTGQYVAAYQYAKNFGNYVALSPMSEPSSVVETKANGITVVIPSAALAARDFQAEEVWVYLAGGAMDGYYRFATAQITGNPVFVDANTREVQAVINNIAGITNLTTPPDDVISIAGPYYGRLLVLTPYGVYLSQQNNPDTFTTDEIIKIGDGGEVPYWMVIVDGRVLVGTSSTIWELTGTFARFPNGTLDVRLSPLNVIGPNDHVVATDGPFVAYMAPDGPRLLAGGASRLLSGAIDLLLRGYTRYGVPPMNLGLGAGRSRMAIKNGFLYMIAPESPYDNGSPVIYRYDLSSERGSWWRTVYPYTLLSIYKEPSNDLRVGDDSGTVYQIDIGTQDNGSSIDFSFQTIYEAPGGPLIRKDFHDVIFNTTGGESPSANLYADQATTPTMTFDLVGTDVAPLTQREATALNGARRVGLVVDGSSSVGFKFFDWNVNFRERPLARARWDTGFPALASTVGKELVWFRKMFLTLNSPGNVVVSIYFSGVLNSQYTIPVTPNITDVYWVPLEREVKGRQPLVVVESITPEETGGEFELYKIGYQLRNTGTKSEMQSVDFVPESSAA